MRTVGTNLAQNHQDLLIAYPEYSPISQSIINMQLQTETNLLLHALHIQTHNGFDYALQLANTRSALILRTLSQ